MGPRTESNIPNPEQLDFYRIKVKVAGTMVTGNLLEDLKIPEDPESLASEIAKHPSQYFYWSSVAEVAKGEYEKVKKSYEVWYQDKYLECKRQLMEEMGKTGITEAMVKAVITEKYKEENDAYQEALLQAEYKRNILVMTSKAFLEKGSSMINLLSWRKAHLSEVSRGY